MSDQKNASKKLYLCQVLEEEYKHRHGVLPNDDSKNPPENEKEAEERRLKIYKKIHEEKPSALCLSGGGIRSATFALGVIQGLANHDKLDKFNYLSTVSGGGYIGSWLTAWIHRHEEGLTGVIKGLKNQSKSVSHHEPEPIKHLRSYSNYLAPKLGFMSVDMWTLVAIYLRNLLLNWFLIIPIFIAVLTVPRFCVSVVLWEQSPVMLMWGILGIGSIACISSIWYIGVNYPSNKKYNNSQLLFLSGCLLPLIVSASTLTTFWAWYFQKYGDLPLYDFIVFGIIVHFAGWFAYSLHLKQFKAENFNRGNLLELMVVLATGAGGGFLGWYAVTQFFPDIRLCAAHYVCFAAPSFLGLFLIVGVFFVGLVGIWIKDKDLEWLARFGAWVLIVCTIWSIASVLVIFGPVWLSKLWEKTPTLIASAGGISGIITVFLSYSSKTPSDKKQKNNGLVSLLINNTLVISASIFIVFLIMTLSLVTDPVLKLINSHFFVESSLTKLTYSSNFRKAEFRPQSNIKKLCSAINEDFKNKIPVQLYIDGEKGLNNLLDDTNFYSDVLGAKLNKSFSNDVLELVDKTEEYRNKKLSDLSLEEQNNIKWLNRLLLEEIYPEETPKKHNPDSHLGIIYNTPCLSIIVLFSIFCCIAVGMSFGVNINKFSLHSIYRNRLTRAYLGASNPDRNNKADQFTGFNEKDDIPVGKLENKNLFHVVNTTLNLVKGNNLAWQQRMAAPFTITPSHAGCSNIPAVGYRDSNNYGGKDGISLGTAITISGAAVSPNMGSHTSPILAFLLTLFNVRIGMWLGNPNNNKTFCRESPRIAMRPIFSEAFGLTDETKPYIYLSDGGHFENLGLYEMVLRRCHLILVVDAGCDAKYTFEDLGNAIRKIRIDLRVPIVFDKIPIYSHHEEKKGGKHFAIGTVQYSQVDGENTDGKLIYIKPALCEDEPYDIRNYGKENPEFPHEPTGDQFFSESQFESYRMLGLHAIEQTIKQNPIIEEILSNV